MKKILPMTVGLITVIALFAMMATARNEDRNDDGARTETAAADQDKGEGTAEGADDEAEDYARHLQ